MNTDDVVFAFDWDTSEEGSAPELAPPVKPPRSVAAPPTSEGDRGLREVAAANPIPRPLCEATKMLVRGQRVKLADLAIGSTPFEITLALAVRGGSAIDVGCAGLDAQNRLSDDRYFVFYNQRASPCGGVVLVSSEGGSSVLRVDLAALPSTIMRLVILAGLDGPGVMGDLVPGLARVQAIGTGGAEFHFGGSDFGQEKALMILELYRKENVWRIAALGQGFAGGLAALLEHFGAKVA